MFEQSEITRARNNARTKARGVTKGKPVRAALVALASVAVAGLWPVGAKAQTIIGIPQPVIVTNPPAPVFNPFPGVTVFDGFSFGTLPTTSFTFGSPIPPGGYYFWPGGPAPALDIGPPIGLPINNGLPIDSPFVVNTNPAPPPQPSAPPAPAQPTLPESAFIQHGLPRIVVKVGRTDQTRAKATSQNKSKPSSKQTASKPNPSN